MTEISDRFRRLAAGFTARVEAVPADRWDDPAPCEGWVARDVVRHMVDNVKYFFGTVGVDPPAMPGVDDDPVGAWSVARDALQAALDDPAIADREFEGVMGTTTLAQMTDRFGGTDLIVHSWDLARATGGDERLDPADVHDVYEAMRPMGDMLRSPGAFGPEVDVPDDADEQTKFLAFLGRRA